MKKFKHTAKLPDGRIFETVSHKHFTHAYAIVLADNTIHKSGFASSQGLALNAVRRQSYRGVVNTLGVNVFVGNAQREEVVE